MPFMLTAKGSGRLSPEQRAKMQLRKAERKKVKLKMGIAGPTGSGKTYSALLLARGLVDDWEKVAIIDTENGSADLYCHLGGYGVLPLSPPFEPEKYAKALETCVKAGAEVVIIDSMSQEWSGEGGVLDYQSKLGGKFQDWAKATPRHRAFIDAILQAPVHVICCSRVKTDWAIEQNERGKATPVKMGLKVEQRDGIEYEYTVSWRLSQGNLASCDKDRTGLFHGKADFKITEQTGKELRKWAETGTEQKPTIQVLHANSSVTYDNKDKMHKEWLMNVFKEKKTPKELWKAVAEALNGEERTIANVEALILTASAFGTNVSMSVKPGSEMASNPQT